MRKQIIIGSALVCAFCLFSSVTAVPQSQSTPVMNALSEIEERQCSIDEYLNELSSKGTLDGLFDFIVQLIQWLADLIGQLLTLVNSVIEIISLLMSVLSFIQVLLDIIEYIMNLFNPEINACTG